MNERGPEIVQADEVPQDTKVVSVKIECWLSSEAREAKFSNLIQKELKNYSVAVGLNSNGDRVAAAVLEPYRRINSAHRKVLQEKGNDIFGLTDLIPHHPK